MKSKIRSVNLNKAIKPILSFFMNHEKELNYRKGIKQYRAGIKQTAITTRWDLQWQYTGHIMCHNMPVSEGLHFHSNVWGEEILSVYTHTHNHTHTPLVIRYQTFSNASKMQVTFECPLLRLPHLSHLLSNAGQTRLSPAHACQWLWVPTGTVFTWKQHLTHQHDYKNTYSPLHKKITHNTRASIVQEPCFSIFALHLPLVNTSTNGGRSSTFYKLIIHSSVCVCVRGGGGGPEKRRLCCEGGGRGSGVLILENYVGKGAARPVSFLSCPSVSVSKPM